MTAEIALMNRSAVALAADSAVTIETASGVKVYNSINKLFMLSKHHPVGIMIYGAADFMDVPWELIIKLYRERLDGRSFDTLSRYAQDFVQFVSEHTGLFPKKRQDEYALTSIHKCLREIHDRISDEVDEHIAE